jgi:hypothetical protein
LDFFTLVSSISNSLLGAPVLTLDLLVDTAHKRVSGIASVFQATWPTVNFRTQVWGSFSETKLTANVENHIILTLDGGPSGPLSQIAQTFHLRGILGGDWASGFVDYRYEEKGQWHEVSTLRCIRHPASNRTPRRIRNPCTPWPCSRRRPAAIWRSSDPWCNRPSNKWRMRAPCAVRLSI